MPLANHFLSQIAGNATSAPTISTSTASTNIICSFPFSDLHYYFCFYRLAGPPIVNHLQGILETDIIEHASYCQMLVTLSHRLSLSLIPSKRPASRFLFASLYPVCLHSELMVFILDGTYCSLCSILYRPSLAAVTLSINKHNPRPTFGLYMATIRGILGTGLAFRYTQSAFPHHAPDLLCDPLENAWRLIILTTTR